MMSVYNWQVKQIERVFKHKIRPENAFDKCVDFDVIMSRPKEDLHQFFIGLYGEHIIPASFYQYTQVLRRPDLRQWKSKVSCHKQNARCRLDEIAQSTGVN